MSLGLLAGSRNSWACSCVELRDVAEGLEKSALVVAGKVLDVRTVTLPEVFHAFDGTNEARAGLRVVAVSYTHLTLPTKA